MFKVNYVATKRQQLFLCIPGGISYMLTPSVDLSPYYPVKQLPAK